MSQAGFLILIETLLIIAIIGTKLYKAKTNDGKITTDEVLGILTESQTFVSEIIVSTLSDLASISGSGEQIDIKAKISEKIKEYLKTSTNLSESHKDLIIENTDKYVEIIYDKLMKKKTK